jgi:drug/metabolite transporter (DMT)-like permease
VTEGGRFRPIYTRNEDKAIEKHPHANLPARRWGHKLPGIIPSAIDARSPRRHNARRQKMALDFSMKIYVKLILTALFWGGTFVAGRLVAQDVGPFSIAFLRFAIASILLLLLTWKLEGGFPGLNGSQIVLVILLGMTGIFTYNVLFFKGLKLIEAGRASLIIATCPVFITLCSALFLKEKINLTKALGIVISVCGAVIVISKGNIKDVFAEGVGLGELYILCCVLCWVAYSLIGQVAMKGLSPLACVSYSATIGAVALFVPAVFEGLIQNVARQSLVDWLCISYLGIFGTVIGFVWYYQGVERLGPTKAGLFINFVPVFGVLSAFLILREPITLSLAAGAVLVISGVYLTNKKPGLSANPKQTGNLTSTSIES